MASCADEFDRNFMVGRPGNSAEYAYLNDYKALKEYVSDPNFHLGIGTDAADYAKQGATYVITNVNFNETVAGNAMKMASCVDKDGNMNFATVESYVNEAAKAGMNVYGHTLAWHAQQPVEWLNTLMADKPLPVTPGVENSCLVFHNGTAGANQWDKQAIYTLSTPMVQGKTYIVKISVKTDDDYAENVFGLWPIWSTSPNKNQWGGSNDVQYLASYGTSKDFKDLEWEFAAAFDHDQLQFVFGKVGGDVYLDNVSCKEKGSDAEMIANGTFDSNSLDGWSANWGGPSFEIGSVTTGGGTPGVFALLLMIWQTQLGIHNSGSTSQTTLSMLVIHIASLLTLWQTRLQLQVLRPIRSQVDIFTGQVLAPCLSLRIGLHSRLPAHSQMNQMVVTLLPSILMTLLRQTFTISIILA